MDIEDLSSYSFDAEKEIIEILSKELSDSINKEIMNKIVFGDKKEKIKRILENIEKDEHNK